MVLVGVALFYIKSALLMVFVALIISSALHGPVEWLYQKKIPRIVSTLAIYLLGGGVFVFLLYIILPIAVIQLRYFLDAFSALKIPLLDILGAPDALLKLDIGANGILDAILSGGPTVIHYISTIIGNVFFAAISLIIAFYLTLSRDGLERFIKAFFPPSQDDYVIGLYHRTRRRLGHWLGGQLILSCIVSVLVFAGLSILKIDYALIIALLAFVLELIPYVGPITTGVIAFLVALPKSLFVAVLAVVIFILIHELEGNVLVPLIVGKTVGLDSVIIVIAMLAGSELAGIVGIIVAVPTVIILQEIINDWGVRRRA